MLARSAAADDRPGGKKWRKSSSAVPRVRSRIPPLWRPFGHRTGATSGTHGKHARQRDDRRYRRVTYSLRLLDRSYREAVPIGAAAARGLSGSGALKRIRRGPQPVLTDSESDTRTGVLVEYGRTQQIFEDPADSRTEAYVTGRMG